MSKISAGLLMYRRRPEGLEVFLAHPGGPFFRNKDDGAWSIPKGEVDGEEDLLSAAKREFEEETGLVPTSPLIALSPIKQKSGKTVHAWAFEGDCDPAKIVSNSFELEWPPRSGKRQTFPEIDRAEFFDLATAAVKINPAQAALLDELAERLAV
jgi:predicted NUDIX family NTP pyrophosphohydrolase